MKPGGLVRGEGDEAGEAWLVLVGEDTCDWGKNRGRELGVSRDHLEV